VEQIEYPGRTLGIAIDRLSCNDDLCVHIFGSIVISNCKLM
jgi:hypothetical protein